MKNKFHIVKCIKTAHNDIYKLNHTYELFIDKYIYVSYDENHACRFTREEVIEKFEGDYITILKRKDKLKKLNENE